jgi:hypothetical protein
LRTKGTSDEEDIATKKDQVFEAKSYFLIDTDSMIIAYLYERAAPQIDSLEDWIYSSTKKSNGSMPTVWGQVTGIATADMIDNLKKAAYIGSIEYLMEIPTNLAVEYTHLKESDYKKLQNQKLLRLKCDLVVKKRGVSSFNDAEDVEGFFNALKNNPLINKIKVKMKSKKEDHVTEVRLLNNPLNYSIEFDFNSMNDVDYDEIISDRIQFEYNLHEDEISDLYR